MADSTLVKFSGDWIFYQGLVADGATLAVLNAGGADNDYASIFTDASLTVSSANPITADSGGLMPFAYIGTDDYKIILKTKTGVEIKTQDNIPGASSTAISANVAIPIETVNELTGDTTLGTANIGQTLNCTPSSDFTVTLGSAVTIGDGKGFRIVHTGASHYVKIVSSNGETIARNDKSVTAFSLVRFGHAVKLISDGANWLVVSETQPGPVSSGRVLPIADRVSAAPSSPNPGTLYIVSSSFSTYATGDVLEADGQGGFTAHTPPTDCGWLAFVQDENLFYRFIDSAWVAENASTSRAGTVKTASQSVQETSTATDTAVTPATQQFHPSAAKWWLKAAVSGGTPSVSASYNNTSITDTGQGDLTATIATDFSSANWSCLATVMGPDTTQGRAAFLLDGTQAAGAVEFLCYTLGSSSPSKTDPTTWNFAGYGDQ